MSGDMSLRSPAPAAVDAALVAAERPPLARHTERAYRADRADFAAWCARYDLTPLPAAPLSVRRYLVAL